MFNLAEIWGLRPTHSNPCRGVRPFPERKRERFLNADELSRLGAALADETHPELPSVITAVRLLALTGCRVGEILALKWDHVDLKAGLLRLADAKAGPRNVTLGAPAISLLAELPKDRSSYVVWGSKPDMPLTIWTLEDAWKRIREAAKLTDARLHDLRHTVGTYAGQAGLNAFIVRDLLGHKTLAMTGRYVERDADPMRAAADSVSGRIAAAMAGEKGAEVVPFSRAQG
jgi:integrase